MPEQYTVRVCKECREPVTWEAFFQQWTCPKHGRDCLVGFIDTVNKDRVAALEAELRADLLLWEPLIERLDAEDGLTGLLKLRVASIQVALKGDEAK